MDKLETLLNSEFPVNQTCHYLNHAAVAPWPSRATDAVAEFARENALHGASHYPQWMATEQSLRQNLATILNADISEIAFVKNTSEALSFVAYGISWQPGDVVVISDEEFPSNRIVWESLASRGVIVEKVSLSGDTPEQFLLEAISRRPRLLAISAVQFASGTCVDLALLGRACQSAGVLFCVDAIQAIGAQPFDVRAIHCDFAMADGHKWLLGPEGLGVFYVRTEVMDQLSLSEYGWHMVEHAGDYSRSDWQIARSARRFECGSPNMLAAYALKASTDLLLSIGMETVAGRIHERINYLAAQVRDAGMTIITPQHSIGRSGILTIGCNGRDPVDIWKQMMSDQIICMHRGGGIRLSPHCHTPFSALTAATEKLKVLCRS